jgi:integrase
MGKRGPQNTEHLYRRGRIWWCWYYDADGIQQRRSTGCSDKTAARLRLAEWERAAVDPAAREAQTLNDALQTLLDDRRANTGSRNVDFLETKVRPLVTVFGSEMAITGIRDATTARRYIDDRRKMRLRGRKVSDRTIMRELQVLVMALRHAKGRGRWSGDLEAIIPDDFDPTPTPKGDTITRQQALRLFPRLSSDAAAAAAFALATGAEMAALNNALKSDIPQNLSTCDRILIRGTKTEARHAFVPVATDEQRLLLDYARRHAQGAAPKLFGGLHRMWRELHEACVAEDITPVSSHDLRRSAGQWMVDLSVPLEIVSRYMRHRDTATTENVYARVRDEDVTDRMIAAIDPSLATHSHKARKAKKIETITKVPEPRDGHARYEVNGKIQGLDRWATETGISRSTLYYRVVVCGLSMAEAISKGSSGRPRGPKGGSGGSGGGSGDCDTGVIVSVDSAAPNERKSRSANQRDPKKPPKFAENPARPRGLEPPTNGLEGRAGGPFSAGKRAIGPFGAAPVPQLPLVPLQGRPGRGGKRRG